MGQTRSEGDFLVPAGTVTFLLTDVEGSTKAWESDSDAMAQAMVALDRIVSDAIGAHAGVRPVEQGEGDSAVAAFAHASDALACALEMQLRLRAEPVSVRIGIHTGEAQRRDSGNYFGQAIHRAARVRSLAHGGQTLLSRATHDLVLDRLPEGVHLQDAGTHRLRDLSRPEQVYQLCHPDLPADFPPVRSLDSVPNNLPVQLTSFIGREREIAEIRRLLREGRLLTLTGSGGCGKTRLALQSAAALLDEHPDGVWFVELAPTGDSQLVASLVASACRVKEVPGQALPDTLAAELRDARALIVLDNCEHVVSSCAELARRLLTACPSLTILATSQAPIGIEGEVTWLVPSLDLPSESDPPRIEALTQYEAVRLFIDRAKRARPNFAVTDENAPAVAQICHRLEGIPLAIELAAARTRMMGPERILSGLADRFRLLTGGSRTAVPRQQTLEASVDWSHALLSDVERTLLRRLSVFPGPFTLDAAETVGAADPIDRYAVLDLLSDLVDKCLVQVEEDERYRLLETVRIYASRRLAAAGEEAGTRDLHLCFYADHVERIAPTLDSGYDVAWLGEVDACLDNVRAAMDWAVERDRAGEAMRMSTALTYFWIHRGHLTEGRRRGEQAVGLTGGEPHARCSALVGLCLVTGHGGGFATEFADRALDAAREVGDPRLLGAALSAVAFAHMTSGGRAARQRFEDAVDACRAADERVALAWSLLFWGLLEFYAGDPARARSLLSEAFAVAEDTGNALVVMWSAYQFGSTEAAQGDLRALERPARVLLEVARAVGDRQMHSIALSAMAYFVTVRGDYGEARRLLDQAESIDRGTQARRMWLIATGVFEWATGTPEPSVLHLGEYVDSLRSTRWSGGYSYYLSFLGRAREAAGDRDRAARDYEEAVAVARESRVPPSLGFGLSASARLHKRGGDLDRAEALAHEALVLLAEVYRSWAVEPLETCAALAAVRESPVEAARLFGAAQAMRDALPFARFPIEQEEYDADLALARDALGEDGFRAAFDEGAALSLDEAVAYAQRGRGERKRPSSGWASLTPAELQVLPLVAQHLTNAQIGERLFMSPTTVKTHLQHMYAKVGVPSRAQLGAEALRRGLA